MEVCLTFTLLAVVVFLFAFLGHGLWLVLTGMLRWDFLRNSVQRGERRRTVRGVLSQIWHAAVDRAQTWVWWASGIVLGAAILTLFALFEKRRNDVLRVIEEIKAWR